MIRLPSLRGTWRAIHSVHAHGALNDPLYFDTRLFCQEPWGAETWQDGRPQLYSLCWRAPRLKYPPVEAFAAVSWSVRSHNILISPKSEQHSIRR